MSRTAPVAAPAPPPTRPRNLHVAHSWGGGLTRWIRDFAAIDPHSDNLVLTSRSTDAAYGLGVELTDGGSGARLGRWDLEWPICETAIEHPEYAAILHRILAEHGVEHIYVSTFVGHSLDVLTTATPTTVVYHDYYPFCVGINLHFGRVCTSCTSEELDRCLAGNPLSGPFRHNSGGYRRRLREAYFRKLARPGIRLACPSPSVVANLTTVDSRFRAFRFDLIAHGADLEPVDCFGGAEEARRLRLVVLGQISLPKGLLELRALFPRLRLIGDLYLVGASHRAREFAEHAAVTFIEQFPEGGLTSILQRIRPDLAVFLSIVPETFSYTLSEAWAHRLPVWARPVGSLGDRVRPGENGFWLDDDTSRALAFLLRLDEDRARLRDVHRALGGYRERSVRAMVDDYYALREDAVPLVGTR